MNTNVFVFGTDTLLADFLSSAVRENDRYFYFQKTPLDYSFILGDIIILISDDINEIKRVGANLPPEVPLMLLTRNYEWFNLVEFPLLKVITYPLSVLMLRTYLGEMKEYISKYRFLEKSLVGCSDEMKKLRRNIIFSSTIDTPVNIYGESGTGKTLAARLIHKLRHSDRDMVYINCANLSSSLFDSDLFGHAKGAFTSASSSRRGLLSMANNSTLFLDEIGNLSLNHQAKLLDTIENGRYRSVGDDSEHVSSFRLITAGQESLESLVEKKKLRKDFYYRISSFSFSIKPLRDHKEDIPDIVRYYEEKRKTTKRHISNYDPFFHSDWKGNIRELLHYLDRVFLV